MLDKLISTESDILVFMHRENVLADQVKFTKNTDNLD